MKIFLIFFLFGMVASAQEYFYYNSAKKVLLTPLETNQTSIRTREEQPIRYFTNQNGVVMGVSDEILLQTETIEEILLDDDLLLVTKITDTLYLLKVTDSSKTLQKANQLHERGDVFFAHPNFYKKVQKR